MTQAKANLVGALAILFWGALALLSVGSAEMPPFQIGAMGFGIGALALTIAWPPKSAKDWLKLPPAIWLLGVCGIWLYHALYFFSVQNAPAIEASLIAYLWPLLIVVFSSLFAGERLGWQNIIGVLLGFLGAILVIGNGSIPSFETLRIGHLTALIAAFIWSSYSVISRRFGDVSSQVVILYLWMGAVLFLLMHLGFEETIWPQSARAWGSVILLGLFPLGLAFVFWDIAMKRGNILWLGTLSYGAPLISALLLIAFGYAQAGAGVIIGAVLITLAAIIASLGARKPKS